MAFSWLNLRGGKKEKAPVYKKGHMGLDNTAKYVAGVGWVLEGDPTPSASSTLPPPPKTSTVPSSSESEAASTSAPPQTTIGHPMTMSLANRYAKPAGVSKASSATPSTILPVPGVGRGRGQGGRGGPIRTFVPHNPGSTAAAVAPAWMTKKTPDSATSEGASSSAMTNPFASSFTDPTPPEETPAPTPSLFVPTAAPDADSFAAPAESAAHESLDESAAQSPLDTASPMEAESATQRTPALFTPAVEPINDPTPDPTSTPMETQESTGQSPLDDAFGGSALDATFGGGNGNAGSGGLDDTTTGDPLGEAFGGASPSGGGLDDAFGGGGGLDGFGSGGGGSGLDAFGGGGGGPGGDEQSGLDDTFGGALAEGAIGQLGPSMPSVESATAAAGPKFPSRDGSETRASEDFFGTLPGEEGGAVEEGPEAASSSPAPEAATGLETAAAQGEYDVDAMEERAGVAAAQDYNGFSWQQMMETGQQWRDYGYPEDQVRGFLADYSLDLEVYDYWLWRYYPEWIEWYRNQQSQAGQDLSADTAATEQSRAGNDTAAESNAADAPEVAAGIEQDTDGLAEPMVQDHPQALELESAPEAQSAESASAEQPEESQTEDNYQLSFSLGVDAAESEFPAFGNESASGNEDFAIALGSDAAIMNDSSAQQDPSTIGNVIPETESLDADSMIPEVSTYAESAQLPEDDDSAHKGTPHDDSFAESQPLPETASGLAAEDSFAVDTQEADQGLAPFPAKGQSAFANTAFDGDDDQFKESPYFNPMYDSGASPEQPSRSQSPFPGNAFAAQAAASSNQAGGVNRELSFGPSGPDAKAQQSKSSGSPVQHVESLGSWLGQGQGDATRRPSVKLSGPLPWDLLSESSEDELTPRERQSLVKEQEEQKPVQQQQPHANGTAVQKAPAPDAKGMLTSKTMSIADQLATGLLTAGEHLQARTGLFEQGRGAFKKLAGNFAPSSSSSPPKLYNRPSARLADIYGNESEGEEGDNTPRLSELAELPRTGTASDMDPEASHDGSPHQSPRPKHAASSDEEEEERPQVRRKKTGDEPPSRQASLVEQAEVKDFAEDAMQRDPVPTDDEDEQMASQDSDQGWEDMDAITMPEAEHPAAAETLAQPSITEPATAVEPEVADSTQAGQIGEEPPSEGLLEDDDAEGWEDMDDLPPSAKGAFVEAAGEAVDGADAVVDETRAEVKKAKAASKEVAAAQEAPADEEQQDTAPESSEQKEGQPATEDAASLQIPFGTQQEEEEGWEGFDELDLPAQATEPAESAQEALRTEALETGAASPAHPVSDMAVVGDDNVLSTAGDNVLSTFDDNVLSTSDDKFTAVGPADNVLSTFDDSVLSTSDDKFTAVGPADSAGPTGLSQLKEPVSEQAGPGPSQREEELEERLKAVERQLAARDAEVVTMTQQLDEHKPLSSDLASLKTELADSQRQLKAAQTESTHQAEAFQALQQEVESWQSQHSALMESTASELTTMRQQLADAESYSDDLATLKKQVSQAEASSLELDTLRQQLKQAESSSAELLTLRQQLSESESTSAELAGMRQQLTEAESENAKLSTSLDEAEEQAAKLEQDLQQLQESSSAAAAEASQAESQWQDQLAKVQSELESTLERHRVTLAERQGELSRVTDKLTAATSEKDSLTHQLAKSSSEQDALLQQVHASEAKCAELNRKLVALTQQRSSSDQQNADLLNKLEDATQKLSASEIRCSELESQLEEANEAHSRVESEMSLLSQQSRETRVGAESPSGSSSRKVDAVQEELEDIRSKFSTAEARILELEEGMNQLAEAMAAAEAAVQEHLVMRERQTERIRKAKAGGPKGLPMVTAEREDAILRADKAELELTKIRAQLASLQKQLDDNTSTHTSSFHATAESAPVPMPDSPPRQPPASSQNGDSHLSAEVAELTQQLEAASVSASAVHADLASARTELAAERGVFESTKAALSTDMAMLTQQVEELSFMHSAQHQQAETLGTELAEAKRQAESASAERDSFAERIHELESELRDSARTAEAMSAEKAELSQQLEGLSVRAGQDAAAEEEVRQLRDAHRELQEKLQGLEEEAQENFDKFSGKEEECDRLEAQLEALRQSQTSAEDANALNAELESLRQQLVASQGQAQSLEQEFQAASAQTSLLSTELDQAQGELDSAQSSAEQLELLQAQLREATQKAESLSADLATSQEEAGRMQQEAAEQAEELQQQLQERLLAAGSLTERALSAEESGSKATNALAVAEASIDELQQQLIAAEEARDEFVDLLSPKKAPRPAGSPAPKATETQLRAALKAARESTNRAETAATSEMAGAEEAFMLLGDAEIQIMVLSQVLEANGIEPAFVLSNAEAEPSEEAFSGSDDEEEQEEGDEPEVPSVASSAGEDAVPGQLIDNGQQFDSPTSTSRAGHLQESLRESGSSTSPAGPVDQLEEPPLQAASSPVPRAIPFMSLSHSSSPTRPQEISLDTWGSGPAQEGVEGWDDADDWMNQ